MYNPEDIAEFDAFEPGDPKNPAYVDAVIDAADTGRDEPTQDKPEFELPGMSPLGQLLFDLATTEARVHMAIIENRREEE